MNIQSPYQRRAAGFDTDDLCLDVVIDANTEQLTWSIKDADDLAEREALGIYSEAQVHTIREAAAAAIEHIERRDPPFDGSWAAYRPDPSWPMPERLPETWTDGPSAIS